MRSSGAFSLSASDARCCVNLPPLILASASPRRAELLRQVVFDFQVVPARVEEPPHEHLTGRELSLLHAYRKARAVAKRHPDMLVLGADTVVYLGTTSFGKPRDRAHAAEMLAQLQGHTHQVATGVCLIHQRAHRQRMFAEITEVTFRALDDARIRAYLQAVDPLDKAGAYALQEHGEMIVQSISGSYTNVVGLPLERLKAELEAWCEAG